MLWFAFPFRSKAAIPICTLRIPFDTFRGFDGGNRLDIKAGRFTNSTIKILAALLRLFAVHRARKLQQPASNSAPSPLRF